MPRIFRRAGAPWGATATAALLAGTLGASPAQSAPITLAGALRVAQDQAPELQARALQVEAAQFARRAAGALPDPRLQLGLDNFPVSGPAAGRFGAEDMTMARVGLAQELPNAAKRRAARERAATDIAAAEAERGATEREVRAAVAVAWVELLYAERRLAALDQAIGALDPLWDAAFAGVASGAARPAAAPEAQRIRAELQDRRSALAAAVLAARARLGRWVSDAQVKAEGPSPPLELDAARLRAGLEGHPNLVVRDAVAGQAGADLALARAEKRPDLGLELAYQRRDPMFGDMVSVGVTVSLPLFARTRQDPIISARTATASQARAEREAARRALAAELDAGLAEQAMRRDQWLRARDTLLPLAQSRADLETASYAAGRAGVVEVTEALAARAEAQLTLLEREANLAIVTARLAYTFGSDQ